MRLKACVSLIVLCGALAGCASDGEPSAAELKARWDAQNIFPPGYKNDLLAFFRTYLNDPEHVRGAMASQPVVKTVGPGDRYIVCVSYSERKQNGKYENKDGYATYVSAKLDRFFDAPADVKSKCQGVPMTPFPEMEKLKR